MSTNTAIEWTDHTFNPWWGCVKVAQGCKMCYAEGVAERFYGRQIWGPNSQRKIASEKVWNDPMRWQKQAEREGRRFRVFCLSMGDVLEDHPQLIEPRKRLVRIIESTPRLDWQLLTKRPENHEMFGWGNNWPGNVWFGASAAIHPELLSNWPHVAAAPAAVRFLSLEPLIGPIDCAQVFDRGAEYFGRHEFVLPDWVIVGGESGQGARPCAREWIIDIIDQCKAARVACFVKQLGARSVIIARSMASAFNNSGEQVLQSDTIKMIPTRLNDPKGGDWNEWPEDLRVREYPKARTV